MIGRRCAIGCETWPDQMLYQKCPRCGEKTRRERGVTPLPNGEAESLLKHALFEDFYERHCGSLGQSVDGPLAT